MLLTIVGDIIAFDIHILLQRSLILFVARRLLGYEGVEVINPEGGKDDAEEEAQKGRWKQEACLSFQLFFQRLICVVYFS